MPDDILKGALDRFAYSEDGSQHNRATALEDIAFGRLSEQWPAKVKAVRELEGRPCLTINRMPTFIRQVVNDARQNKPSISVHPVDGGADTQTAEIIGGLMRSIERGSNASLAYDTAIDNSASCGFGFFRITTDYAHAESFDQVAKIERVANPFSVHWDTSSMGFDASDWEFAFVSDMLTKREYLRRYPKGSLQSFEQGLGEDLEDWTEEDKIRVAEYWLRTEEKKKILRLSDGSVVMPDQMDAPQEIMPGVMVPTKEILAMQGVTVTAERESTFYKVKRRVINGVEVLDEEDWPGTMIPIIPVWGEEIIYCGKRYFRSLIRDARDPQSMLNFWRSASTELVALAPRAPWLVATGSIPPEEMGKWQTANTRSHAYLEYDSTAGPPPQRTAFAGVPAGALQEALNASDDIKSVTGIFDAALGARGNETSGRAITARQRESDKGTFHFIDNMSRAIQYAGRCLIDIIPALYSQRQTIQILGEDQAEKVVRLTQESGTPPTPADPEGRLYNLGVGRYDVTVKVGPNYATQREETREALLEIMARVPGAAMAIGDMALSNMDFPQAQEAAKRVKLMQSMELAKLGLPPDVDQAIQAVESGAWPPRPQPQPGMMPGAPQQPGMPPQGMPPI